MKMTDIDTRWQDAVTMRTKITAATIKTATAKAMTTFKSDGDDDGNRNHDVGNVDNRIYNENDGENRDTDDERHNSNKNKKRKQQTKALQEKRRDQMKR